jgi:hypothetical protein
MYSGVNGMLSHPFPVERIHYIQDWANSREYQDIRKGNYARVSVETSTTSDSSTSEADRLKREIEKLQREIDRQKSQNR